MKTYDTYKPSGIEWIGDIPEHWEMKRLKYCISINDETLSEIPDEDFEINYVEIGDVNYLTGINNFTTYSFKEAPSRARRIVKDGDVIVSTVRTYLKAIAKIKNPIENLIVSTGFAVLRSKSIESGFLGYFTLSPFFINETISNSVGISYPAINSSYIGEFIIALPSEIEQTVIATYLDRKTDEIDRIIANKQKLIELYEDEKISIINQAITRGINKSVAFKDSGVEWLSETPEHWKVKKLGYMGRCQNGISIGGDSFGSGYPFVSYGDVYKNVCLPQSVDGLVNSTEKDRIAYSVEKGDVFFTRTSETSEEIGIASVCMSTIEDATFAGFLIRFRPYSNLLVNAYSKYYFRSQLHRYYFVKEMNIVTRASLSQGLLRNLVVLLPPLEEQVDIANYLDKECLRLDTLIDKFKKQIELFQEYRTTLISEVVTGKVKV